MNVEDIVRSGLHDAAEQAAPIADLHVTAVQRGRRRRTVRRVATTGGVALSVAAIVGVGVVVAGNTGGGGNHVVQVGNRGPGVQRVVADPWWQTWTTDRHFGTIDPAFLTAARPTYDGDGGPQPITVYAAGTMTDGTQWVMFTDPHDGHIMQWLQGWDNNPNFGESTQTVTPEVTWTSWSIGNLAAHNGGTNNQQWLIVVGQPGTTSIDYSADGTTWQPMDVRQGIGVVKITDGFPPATSKVRLSNASGIYAVGAPAAAGAGTEAPDGGVGTASPTPTPTDGSSEQPSTGPADISTPS
jgi:hypothetical protein